MNRTENTESITLLKGNFQAQIAEAVGMRDALNQLFEKVLVFGTDYDRIPGTDKPALLRPGAEMLCMVFRLAPGEAKVIDKFEDWENGIFSYVMGITLNHIDSGKMIASGVGSANSREKKHRYRWNTNEAGEDVQVLNAEPGDLQNTLIKMASKRAYLDAVSKATGVSRMFISQSPYASAAQLEKASTNQVRYIRQLFGKIPEKDALAEISGIAGREITNFDDILRAEASKIIDAKKPAAPEGGHSAPAGKKADKTSAGTFADFVEACSDCGAGITQAVLEYSKSRYGRPLCRNCQK